MYQILLMQCGVLCISPGFPGDCGVQVALPPPHALLISPPLHDKVCHFSGSVLGGNILGRNVLGRNILGGKVFGGTVLLELCSS